MPMLNRVAESCYRLKGNRATSPRSVMAHSLPKVAALFALCTQRLVFSFPKGAPEMACIDMIPKHPGSPSTALHPFQLVVGTGVQEGNLKVRLVTLNKSVAFRGFLIRSMTLRGGIPTVFFGAFEKDASFQQDITYLSCDGRSKSAVTHADRREKQEVLVHWTAETGARQPAEVFFRNASGCPSSYSAVDLINSEVTGAT